MKDIIKETVEAIMRHEKAYGTIDPEFARRLLATALAEQRAAERTRTIEEMLELLVDEEAYEGKVSPVNYNRLIRNDFRTELRAKLEAMKGQR